MIWLDSDEVEDEDVEDADFDWLQPKCSLDHLCQNFDSWSFLLLNFAVLIFVGGGILVLKRMLTMQIGLNKSAACEGWF